MNDNDGYMQAFNNREKYNGLYSRHMGDSKDIMVGEIKPKYKVLDYGCGNGTIKKFVLDSSVTVDGFDPDHRNDYARFHDIKDIRGHYDLILFSHVIEHMELFEARDTLSRLRKMGDRLVLATPNACNPSFDFWQDLTHKRKYSYPDTLSLMESEGWHVEKVYYCYPGMKRSLPQRALLCMCLDCGLNGLFYEYVVVAN